MRVIFLDIDGVLNNHRLLFAHGPDYIDPDMVSILKTIVFSTKSKIVLSSSWRLYSFSRRLVKVNLEDKQLNFIDCTKEIPNVPRSEEIKDYLNSNKVFDFAILDDEIEAGVGLEDRFFQTDPEVGLTLEIADKVINYFRKN
jgi:hypothetical protein